MIQELPFRTGVTDLSHDELLLLDVLFDGAAPLNLLRRENFSVQWNWHSHNFDDAELRLGLDRMCDLGILVASCERGRVYFWMTEHGGELWSRERCPTWERYAWDRYNETKSGRPFVTVVTTSEQIRDDFLRLRGPCGLWDVGDARIRKFEIRNYCLIPWRAFSSLFVAVVMNFDEHENSINPVDVRGHFMAHDQHRTWWRSVGELQKFVVTSA